MTPKHSGDHIIDPFQEIGGGWIGYVPMEYLLLGMPVVILLCVWIWGRRTGVRAMMIYALLLALLIPLFWIDAIMMPFHPDVPRHTVYKTEIAFVLGKVWVCTAHWLFAMGVAAVGYALGMLANHMANRKKLKPVNAR